MRLVGGVGGVGGVGEVGGVTLVKEVRRASTRDGRTPAALTRAMGHGGTPKKIRFSDRVFGRAAHAFALVPVHAARVPDTR